jgi:hypothetical protein
MNREPVAIAGSIVGLIMALVMWLNTMGYLSWTPDQISATEQLVAIAIPLLLSAIGVLLARARVTPSSDPRDTDGAPLWRMDGGEPLGIKAAKKQ